MSVALDLGSHSFRSLRLVDGTLVGRKARAVYDVLADTEAHRRLLGKTDTTFLTCDGGLVVVGDDTLEIAQLLQRPVRPLLPGGRVPAGDTLARQVLNVLLEALLPAGAGEPAAVILPAGHDERTAEFLTGLIRLRGHAPQRLPSSSALLLAESAAEQFTGITVVCGHSGLEIGAAHLGRELACVRLPKAGQWIDEQLARERTPETPLTDKEAAADAIRSPRTAADRVLGRLCRELAWDTAESIRNLLAGPATSLLPRPAAVLCGGGLAQMPGFASLLCEALSRRDAHTPIAGVRLTDPSPYTLARGGLIHVELESRAAPAVA